ncbi:uncharacterized protein B0H64DRAFT_152767 [Chaetomium fimeti]|uniref:Ubiquitin 3 binding protein But2 C-terminal domain-containing protein n=1 Tax=Chaetomium fimeti TaxID=1854472 RepID=A0AAE0HG65_9PEZI|nr:hypothetical protein B0H64DRAFT_152767 [Chaetomium fimeti]
MRSLAYLLSILPVSPVALSSVVSFPYYPYSRRVFYDISNPITDRSMMTDTAQFNFAPFSLTNLRILCTRFNPTVDYSCNLTFAWSDPNSVRQNSVTSGSCQTSWAWDGVTKHDADPDGSDPVASYRSCWIDDDATYFKVAVPGFWHPGNFTLELAHRYRDDEYVLPVSRPHLPASLRNLDVVIIVGAH